MESRNWKLSLLFVLVSALIVYCWAHHAALTNEYSINDDVRQQIFWMQQWQDPGLFPDDPLVRYARNYVPWGVKFLYYAASPLMNPVQFSKIVSGLIFLVTAGFLFGLGRALKDNLTGILLACTLFLCAGFLDRISGGLSRGFAFPLLTGYLFFMTVGNLWAAGTMIFVQSLFNPYIMVLCLVTHGLFFAKNYLPLLIRRPRGDTWAGSDTGAGSESVRHAFLVNIPVAAAAVLMALKYVVLQDTSFGDLVTWSDMAGKIEYTAAGRYGIVPVPSIFLELVRPFERILPFHEWGIPVSVIVAVFGSLGFIYSVRVWRRRPDMVPFARLGTFAYLLSASVMMYVAAYVSLFRLFLPRRYMEYSFTIFYCVLIAIGLRILIDTSVRKRLIAVLIVSAAVVVGPVTLVNVGLFDYSEHESLYRFFRTVPRSSLSAGPPDIMDNVVTFGRRSALVTYELSHTWYRTYWKMIKKRSFDFFRAYYASDPEEIRRFSRANNVDYLVVRREDFPPKPASGGSIHFEPFDTYVRGLAKSGSHFAALDRNAFPIVFENNGLLVLKISEDE